jgi:predicted enzyme related to lactoylglutathione lyase
MHVKFAELPVFNQNRAVGFYTEMLRGKVEVDKPYGDDNWRWIEISIPGGQSHVLFSRREDGEPSDEPALVLVDHDVEGIIESLRSNNVEIITEPKEAPWDPGRRFAEFRDSEGNRIVIGSN